LGHFVGFFLLSQKVSITKDFTINVLICGAGAAGLTLAIDLRGGQFPSI